MNKPHSSTLHLLLLTLGAALIAGCQDKASNDQNPAGTQKHQTLQPNNSAVPTTTPAPGTAEQTFLIQLAAGSGRYLPTPKAIEGGSYSALPVSNNVGPEGGQVLVEETVQAIHNLWPTPAEKAPQK